MADIARLTQVALRMRAANYHLQISNTGSGLLLLEKAA
jgi:hypothetical protein